LKVKNQHGFTFTPAALILIVLMMSGITFFIYVLNIGKSALKIESSTVAKYAAETGIHHLKSQLAGLNDTSVPPVNKWYNTKGFSKGACEYIFTSGGGCTEASRTDANTSRISTLVPLYEKPNDTSSRVVGKYRLILEDGAVLGGGKTATGSVVSGVDRYNNKIWSDATNKNYFPSDKAFRFGVKAEGFSSDQLDSSGNPKTNATPQSVYSVLEVPLNSATVLPGEWSGGSPTQYLLSSNGVNPLDATEKLGLFNNQVITGPIHTNDNFNFFWRGNFSIGETTATRTINNSFQVNVTKQAGAVDAAPISVSRVVRLAGQPANQVTVFAQNFNPVNTNNWVSFDNGSTWNNPVSSTKVNSAEPAPASEVSLIKMVINLPFMPTPTSTYEISLGLGAPPQSLTYYIDERDIRTKPAGWMPEKVDPNITPYTYWPATPNLYQARSEILGLMDVMYDGFTDTIYKTTDDFSLCRPGCSAWNILPFLLWGGGSKPSTGDVYQVTYITPYNYPHKKTYVYDQLSYAGSGANNSFYIHSHKAAGSGFGSFYGGPHKHDGSPFGILNVNLNMNANSDYIGSVAWWSDHKHEISGLDLSTTGAGDENNYFFYWKQKNYKPSLGSVKYSPILAPTNFNYNTQREYANSIFKIILNKPLPKDGGGNYQALSSVPEDRENGYYDASLSGGIIDFRATYFGNDLKYSDGTPVLPVGSKITDTAVIYVNDKQYMSNDPRVPNPDYMKIANTQVSSDYRMYTYRQIPKNGSVSFKSTDLSKNGKTIDGGVIFVRDGAVRIGGSGHHKGNVSTGYVGNNTLMGRNTIIDGRLTIISYSEAKPTTYIDNTTTSTTDNAGDIVITGNVIYKNKIYNNREQMTFRYNQWSDLAYDHDGFRQYTASTQNKFDAEDPSNVLKNSPISITDPSIDWLTDLNGDPTNLSRTDGEKVDSLSLIASNDIKIPVMQYHQDSNESIFNDNDNDGVTDYPDTSNLPSTALNSYPLPYIALKHDILTIHAQLIAGHKITQTKAGTSNDKSSKNDQLIMYGSFYSHEPPNLSYFDRQSTFDYEESMGRIYMYDKTHNSSPLAGSPYFAKDNTYSGDKTYTAGINFPRVLPGTWKVVTGN
jgi:hypothetical protein